MLALRAPGPQVEIEKVVILYESELRYNAHCVEFLATLWRLRRVRPFPPLHKDAGKGGRARGGPFVLPTLDRVSLAVLCACAVFCGFVQPSWIRFDGLLYLQIAGLDRERVYWVYWALG